MSTAVNTHAESLATRSSRKRAIRLDELGDGQVALTLDGGDSVFLFDAPMLDALAAHVEALKLRSDVCVVFLRGTGTGTWCGGADLEAFGGLTTQDAVRAIVAQGQTTFEALAQLRIPTVALIDGVALGGGFELGLACTYRVASESARVGLPEVMLGIIPAWGGCTRLTRLIGPIRTLDVITTGRTFNALRAYRAGLVDSVVPRTHLLEEGARLALSGRERKPIATTTKLLWATAPGRYLVRSQARKKVLAVTSGHYPAPLAAIDVITGQHGLSVSAGLQLEKLTVAPLATGAVARSLLRVFQATRPSSRPQLIREAQATPAPQLVGVIGAGVMGGAIARILAVKGIPVRLIDPSEEALARTRRALAEELERRSRSGDMTRAESRRRLLVLSVALSPSGLRQADLVIEAVPERADAKAAILARLREEIGPETIVASNTSSFPVNELAKSFGDPSRLVGLHFFNPVDKLPLVEIIRGLESTPEAVRRAAKVALELGKTPIIVGDGPGFLVNRLFIPYLRAACDLAVEGVPLARIDAAIEAWGMAMGPFRLMDMIGLDVLHDVGKNLASRGAMGSHALLETLLARGCTGQKAQRGFYVWKGGKTLPNPALPDFVGRDDSRTPAELATSLVAVLGREARAALNDGTVMSVNDIDIASIMGMGFPAWRGGLAHAMGISDPT